jgi:predicted nucleotidyltransferase
MITLENIEKATKLQHSRIKNVYIFGSQVYGIASEISDWDVLVVANSPNTQEELKIDNLNIHILSPDRFQLGLKNHNIRDIECIMSPDWAILKETVKFKFGLNKIILRHSISHINSNSYVKCKKKLAQGDYYIGIKSLWHAMRIAMFGYQLATEGKITDFSCANYLWNELISKTWTWEELEEKFKQFNNNLLSIFRIHANKF